MTTLSNQASVRWEVMSGRKFHIVDLTWEGPFPVDYDRDTDSYSWTNALSGLDDLAKCGGLYQIYGRHPVYGQNVLLYIGCVSPAASNRTLVQRLNEHVRTRFLYTTNLAAHMAAVKSEGLKDGVTIEVIESILIYAHQPALNRQNIDDARWHEKSILVRNWSFVGALEACCTNDWEE